MVDDDGNWIPETDDFQWTEEDWAAHTWRIVKWCIIAILIVIALVWAYNAGQLRNEAPDHYQEIEAPVQG